MLLEGEVAVEGMEYELCKVCKEHEWYTGGGDSQVDKYFVNVNTRKVENCRWVGIRTSEMLPLTDTTEHNTSFMQYEMPSKKCI